MRTASSLFACVVVCACVAQLRAQDNRIFRTTPETVAIWEFNDLVGAVGDAVPTGAVIPDLSGNGRDALVKANDSGAVVKGENLDRELFCGDDDLDFAIRRANGNGGSHAATNGDGTAFEFATPVTAAGGLYPGDCSCMCARSRLHVFDVLRSPTRDRTASAQ